MDGLDRFKFPLETMMGAIVWSGRNTTVVQKNILEIKIDEHDAQEIRSYLDKYFPKPKQGAPP
jgi:hypothetical protein